MVVDEGSWENLTPEQMQPKIDEMERYNDQLRGAGAWVSGGGLDADGPVPHPAGTQPGILTRRGAGGPFRPST